MLMCDTLVLAHEGRMPGGRTVFFYDCHGFTGWGTTADHDKRPVPGLLDGGLNGYLDVGRAPLRRGSRPLSQRRGILGAKKPSFRPPAGAPSPWARAAG